MNSCLNTEHHETIVSVPVNYTVVEKSAFFNKKWKIFEELADELPKLTQELRNGVNLHAHGSHVLELQR